MTEDGQRHSRRADRAFARYRRSGDPGAIATLFDLTAGELRRIALHVVGDAATADDLVQATFLAAIENAGSFDGDRPVLPWLTGILRKQALLVHRRERRRPDATRLPEAGELDPVRSAERAELDREVGEAIAQLPEVYRPVLQLYLLHGLGAAEIAATLERPGGTVRTQIVRGLEKLRELLPVGLAGLLAGLLPGTGTAAVRRAVLAAADRPLVLTTAAGLGGMLAMKKTMIGVAAALVALAAGLWTWQEAVPDDAGEPVVPGARVTDTESAPAPTEPWAVARDRVRDTRRDAVTADAPAGAVVRGRVVRDGVPVRGATVMAWRGGVYATTEVDGHYDPPPRCRTTTDAEGGFELTGVPDEFLISAEHEALGCLTPLVGATRGRAELSGLEVEVAPTLELEGVLLDHEGRPIAGHSVATHRGSSESESDRTDVEGVWRSRPHFVATTSDDEGRFSLRVLADHRYLWEIQHPHHPMLRVHHRARDGRLVLRMEKGTTLAGRVFRADGSVAAGAEVILNDYPTRRATCDERGAFSLRGAALHGASYLRVADEESAVFALQPLPDDVGHIRIQLEAPQRIAGRVVDGEGRPRPDVEVSIEGDREVDPGYVFGGAPTWEWANDVEATTTGDDGTFAFERLYEGDFELRVATADGSLKRTQVVHSGASALEIRLDAATSESVTLRGRAIDANTGEPLPGLRLTVWRREGATSSTGRTHDLVTQDGVYELNGLAPGELALSAVAEDFAILRVPERAFASGAHAVDLALFPERRLEVLVRDAAGAPQRGSVSVRDAEGNPVWMASGLHGSTTSRSLSDGRALLVGLPAMRVTVAASVLGAAEPVERIVDLIEPPSMPLTITVNAPAPRVPIELGVLCCTAGADLSAFAGEPGPSWLEALMSREDVWPPDADVIIWLAGADDTVLCRGTIEAGELVKGERRLRLRQYRSRIEAFDGTGASSPQRPAPVAPAMLHGRAETMVLHVEADGYEPSVREIDGRAAAGSMAKIAVFLRKKR